jgi:DNA polymerase elongation subunit (family B)
MQIPITPTVIEYINTLHKQGLSNRNIAHEVGCSKTTVAKYINVVAKGPKVLLLDLESTPSIVAAFQRFNVNISPSHVIEENNNLISICYKWLGEKKIHKLVQTPTEAINRSDLRLIAEFYDVIEEADVIVAHNCSNFDWPLFKTRCLFHDFPPPKNVKIIDTLKIARSLKFPSNKLESIANYLNLTRKIDNEGIKLWLDCMRGDKKALKTILDYNEGDIVTLEEAYLKLRAYDLLPVNLGLFTNTDEVVCKVCASTDLTKTGNSVYTTVSEFEEVVCNDCGHRQRTRQPINTKSKRKALLA